MNTPFKAVSLSHKETALEIREQFAMNSQACQKLLQYAKELGNIDEMLIISSCNRLEVYFTSAVVSCEQLTRLLVLFTGDSKLFNHLNQFQLFDKPIDAVEHLFRVSIGLESQVLGESQIINQVKKAYQSSADLDLAGPFLHRLMHTIFHTHKIVTQESCFKDCHASVAQATKNLVQRLLPDKTIKVLILGAGQMGNDLCHKLLKMGYDIRVSNRTQRKSLALSTELGIKSIPLKEVHLMLSEVQIVISALEVKTPFLTASKVQSSDLKGHKYLLDLSVPRSIAPELATDPNITLLNMDDVNDEISSTIQKRRNEVPKVESIINSALLEFQEWARDLKVLPVIHQMKAALEKIRQEEIARHLKQIDFNDYDLINDITKRIVERVVKLPALKLKLACKRGEDENMAQVLREIFNINNHKMENQLSK